MSKRIQKSMTWFTDGHLQEKYDIFVAYSAVQSHPWTFCLLWHQAWGYEYNIFAMCGRPTHKKNIIVKQKDNYGGNDLKLCL